MDNELEFSVVLSIATLLEGLVKASKDEQLLELLKSNSSFQSGLGKYLNDKMQK